MRTTASTSKRTTNGSNHHFFSRAQNRKNSRKTVHIYPHIIMAGRVSVDDYFVPPKQDHLTTAKKEAEVKTSASLIQILITGFCLTGYSV